MGLGHAYKFINVRACVMHHLDQVILEFWSSTLGDYCNKFAFILQVFTKYPTLCWSQNGGEEDRLGLYPQELVC